MKLNLHSALLFVAFSSYLFSASANSLASAELFSRDSVCYGRFEVRMRMVSADGVITSFFLWKDKSEDPAVFWHEIDIEVLGNDPTGFQSAIHTGKGSWSEMKHTETFHNLGKNLSKSYNTFILEWTPNYLKWKINDSTVRCDTGEQVRFFKDVKMQYRFNIWPTKNASWAGIFNPEKLPVHQCINYFKYSRYTPGKGKNGSDFTPDWEDNFDSDTLHSRWLTGFWESPDKLSSHSTKNVSVRNGVAILSLTRATFDIKNWIVPQDELGGTVFPKHLGRGM